MKANSFWHKNIFSKSTKLRKTSHTCDNTSLIWFKITKTNLYLSKTFHICVNIIGRIFE